MSHRLDGLVASKLNQLTIWRDLVAYACASVQPSMAQHWAMATVARPRSSESWIAWSSKNLFFKGKTCWSLDRNQVHTNWRFVQVLTSEKRVCYKASSVKMIKSTNTEIPAQPFDIIELCQLSHSQKINMEDSQDVIRCSTWLVAFKAVPCWATAARILPMRVRWAEALNVSWGSNCLAGAP